jgi:hypothetical protein
VEQAPAGFYPSADEIPGPRHALFGAPVLRLKERVMIFLFGRFKEPARLGLGVVIVIIGIVINQLILTLIGAVLAVWGLYTVIGALRSRGRNAFRGGDDASARDDGER